MGAEQSGTSRRADAQRNRTRILEAARQVFADPELAAPPEPGSSFEFSMAEVARRAGVGRATLYRNFPGRRELLEALFADEVQAVVEAAVPSGHGPGAALLNWLHRFAAFEDSKRVIARELLEYSEPLHNPVDPVFTSSRQRVIAAGEPLLATAQRAGDIRADITLVHALDLVLAVVRLERPPDQVETVLKVALDGLRPAG